MRRFSALVCSPVWKSPDFMFLEWWQILVGFARYDDDSRRRKNALAVSVW
jgi:hypothetical protein